MEILKRTLSALLAAVLVFTMLPMPMTASASETEPMTAVTEETTAPTTEAAATVSETTPQTTAAAEPAIVETTVSTEAAQTTPPPAETTEPAVSEPVQSEPPVSEPPASEPPVSEPPATEPALTEPVVTAPAVTEVTEPAATEETEPEVTEETEPASTVETIPPEDRIPQIPDDYYWYVTEETWTKTEPITIVEQNPDGTYSYRNTTETRSGTYKKLNEVYRYPVSTMALTEEDGDYTFESFADLKELCKKSFSSWTYAYYTGVEPLTISEDLTLPKNLDIRFYQDYSNMVIPAGVTVRSNAEFYVDNLTVAGTLFVNAFSRVNESLTVTGTVQVSQTLYVNGNADVTGMDNVSTTGYGDLYWEYDDVTTADELASVVAKATGDTTGWYYSVTIDAGSGFTLNRSLTIPANVDLSVYGYGYNTAFTIAQGCTLTLNGNYASFSCPTVVEGSLVNNTGLSVYNTLHFTSTDGYSGTGTMQVSQYAGDSWDEVVTGLDTSNLYVTGAEYGGWEILDATGKTILAKPTDLTWHKKLEWTGPNTANLVDGIGHMAWKMPEPSDNYADIRIYDADSGAMVRRFGRGYDDDSAPEWWASNDFVMMDAESGNYYFTITSRPSYDSDGNYLPSDPAVSETWTYTKPDAVLGACTNLKFSNGVASWTAPSGYDSFAIRWYYAPTADAAPYQVGSSYGFTGTAMQIYDHYLQENGAGYYYYQIRAVSADITKKCNSPWSAMSGAYYYNGSLEPDEPVIYTEALLKELVESGYSWMTDTVVLKNNYTLPKDATIQIDNGGSITVPRGKTLTVNGYLDIYNGSLIVEPGGKLVLNQNLWLAENAVVDIQGSATYGEYAYVTSRFQNGLESCTVTGVPKERTSVSISIDSDNEAYWQEGLELFENHDYGRAILSVSDDITLAEDLVIPENGIVVIAYYQHEISVTIEEDVTVTNYGQVYIDNNGILNNKGTINSTRGIWVSNNGTVNNTGEINALTPTGDLESMLGVQDGGTFNNDGTVRLYTGSYRYVEGTWNGNDPILLGGIADEEQTMTQAQLLKALQNAQAAGEGFALDKQVILTSNLDLSKYWLTIADSGSLIVPKGKTLTVNGVMLNSGADLVIEEGGKLVNKNAITSYATEEAGGILSMGGTYVPQDYASINIMQDSGTPSFEGFDMDDLTATYEEADEETFLRAINTKDYGYIQVQTSTLELNTPATIPANMTLIVNPTVPGPEIRPGGGATINANLTVKGMLNVNVYYYNPSTLVNNAIISVEDGGFMVVYGNVENKGTIQIDFDSGFYRSTDFDPTWDGEPEQYVGQIAQSALEEKLSNGPAVLSDGVYLEKNMTIISELKIVEGGHIVVPSGVTLTVEGFLWANCGKITVLKGGKLVNNRTVTVSNTGEIWNEGTYTQGTYGILQKEHPERSTIYNIPNKYITLVDVADDEAELKFWLTKVKQDGYRGVSLIAEDMTISEDLVIPFESSLGIRGDVILNAKLTLDGELFVGDTEGGSLTNNGTLQVNKTGYLSAPGSLYSGNAPVNNGGMIVPDIHEITIFCDSEEVDALTLDIVDAVKVKLRTMIDGPGKDALPYITWTSSNSKVLKAEDIFQMEDGSYGFSNIAVGTTKLTATSIATDYNGKRISKTITLTVTPVVAASLTLHELKDGMPVETDLVVLEKSAEVQSFQLIPKALDPRGEIIPQNNKSIKWTSSDTKIATVAVSDDGLALVTVKANADGVAIITAQVDDQIAQVELQVRDYAPRIGSTKVTLNPMQSVGAEILLVPSYENAITAWNIDHPDLDADYDGEKGILTITANKKIENSTINTSLYVTCENGSSYESKLKVTVKNVVPGVTVKQQAKMDLFYTNSEAPLTITAKNTSVDWEKTTLIDPDGYFSMDNNGIIRFTDAFIQKYQENPKQKLDYKATLQIYLDGYVYPVEKVITIGTATSKLSLTTNPASTVLNSYLLKQDEPITAEISVYNKTAKTVLTDYSVTVSGNYVESHTQPDANGKITVTFNQDILNAKNLTVAVTVKMSEWANSIAVNHKVSVSNKEPKVKLGAATLTLNSVFSAEDAETTVTLDQGNLNISGFVNGQYFAAKADKNFTEADKIAVCYENGKIVAKFKDAEKLPKNGTYTFTNIPKVNDVALKSAVTIKVKVVNAEPTVKLSATTLNLNTNVAGTEIGESKATLTNKTGIDMTLVDFLVKNPHEDVSLKFEDGKLTAKLNTAEAYEKQYKFTVYPIVEYENGQSVTLSKALTVTVKPHSKAISVSQSAKGKLDAIDPTSQIVYTISKISNALGKVTDVALEKGSEWFEISELYEDAKGKQYFKLTLKDGIYYSTKTNYVVQFAYTVCGETYTAKEIKLKVTQSALKVTAPAVQYYLSQGENHPLTVKVNVTSPVSAQVAVIGINTDKTSAELTAALGISVTHGYSPEMQLKIWEPSRLKAGKSYKLVLNVVPVGQAEGAKPTQVSVTVKVNK